MVASGRPWSSEGPQSSPTLFRERTARADDASEPKGSAVPSTRPLSTNHYFRLSAEIRNELKSVETEIKYAGYLDQQTKSIERLKNSEQRTIPDWFDYGKCPGLSREMNEKLIACAPAHAGPGQPDSRRHPGRGFADQRLHRNSGAATDRRLATPPNHSESRTIFAASQVQSEARPAASPQKRATPWHDSYIVGRGRSYFCFAMISPLILL